MFTYAELAVTTNFSFLRGASDPEELVKQARALGLSGIGIADRNSVAGVVRAYAQMLAFAEEEKERAAQEEGGRTVKEQGGRAAKEQEGGAAEQEGGRAAAPGPPVAAPGRDPPFRLAVGARLVFADGTPDILAYPQDRAAWGRLTRLLSLGKQRAEKGDCLLGLPDLLDFVGGLNLIVMPPARIQAEPLQQLLIRLKTAAPNRVWLAASMLYRGDDERRLARLADIAGRAFVPLIAVNDVLYHVPERRALQDVVTCIREHLTLEAAGRRLEANAERHLKSATEMMRLFRRMPQAVGETRRFLPQCSFSLEELRGTEYADETRAGYATPQEALVAFANEGFAKRFPGGAPAKVRQALDAELKLIG